MRFEPLRKMPLLIGCAALCILAWPAHAQTPAEFLDRFPVQSADERDAVCAEIVRLGAPAIQGICAALLPSGEDSKARFALSGLVNYVMRPGAEQERAVLSQSIIDAMTNASDAEIKAFLISQLQLLGKEEAVAPLRACLADSRLADPAIRALQSNPAPAAMTALAEALPGAQGVCRLALIKALGDLRCTAVVPALLADAAGADTALRQVALYALANTGAAEAEALISQAAQAQEPYERAEMTAYWLLFARRRAEAGDPASCETICRTLMASHAAPEGSNAACAALSQWAALKGKEAMPELLAAMESPCKAYRGTALRIAASMKGEEITRQWVRKLRKSNGEPRLEMIAMLGDLRDTIGLFAVLDALKDPDVQTRLTAMEAAVRIGGPKVLPALISALVNTSNPEEIGGLKQALLQLPGDKVTDAVEAALLDMEAPARAAGIEILGARRASKHLETVLDLALDADQAVRNTALTALGNLATESDIPQLIDLLLSAGSDEERAAAHQSVVAVAKEITPASRQSAALLEALQKVDVLRKGLVLRALADVGGDAALHGVLAETNQADPNLRKAAVEALAAWHDASATAGLLHIASVEQDAALRDMALAGYVRLARNALIAAEDKCWLYAEALAALGDPACRKALLEGLADLNTLEALELAARCLDDAALQAEAAAACARITLPKNKEDHGLLDPAAAPILQKAVGFLSDEALRQRLQGHLGALPPADAGTVTEAVPGETDFLPLFNGKDLSGWTGDLRGYGAEFGKLVCRETSHFNLFTEKPYRDFILRFEFKLTPGANNGIGIRTPLMSHAAYEGMEIQVLDDSADQYQELHDYQFHGAIYGVAPAERGHLKPAGEWNSQEISAQGRQLTVKTNGVVVLDVNLDTLIAQGTPDGKEHPGLKNEAGHIALLGHGSRVEFRNIRIKELN